MHRPDTIVALATPAQPSAISIIRVSGPDSFDIIGHIFFKPSGKKYSTLSHFRIYYGYLKDKDDVIDEVLVHVMKGPKSYTGEDMIEITCHGSVIVQNKIIDIILSKGARLAEPGEFTKRAFINGKIDLIKAEAVNDLIMASNEYAYKTALYELKGGFSERIKRLENDLLNIVSLFEANIDFPDEDIDNIDFDSLKENLNNIIFEIDSMLSTNRFRNVFWAGIKTIIVGPPNVGKSTLFNTLCGEDRAIITDIPGTTRDFLEAHIIIDNIPFHIIDTAGIHDTGDKIEKAGIERTKRLIYEADLILVMTDVNIGLDDIEFVKNVENKILVKIFNKIDLKKQLELKKFPDAWQPISLKTGEGIEELKKYIVDKVKKSYNLYGEETSLMVNKRQSLELNNAKASLNKARELIETNHSLDIIAQEIKGALLNLKSIIGEVTNGDILDQIFSNFCIGK